MQPGEQSKVETGQENQFYTAENLKRIGLRLWNFAETPLLTIGSVALLNPFDRLKTLRQVHLSGAYTSGEEQTVKSSLENYRRITRQEGFKGLFRGTYAGIMSTMLRVGVQSHFYPSFRNYFFAEGELNYIGGDRILRIMAAASLSTMFSMLVCYPYELLRAQTHAQTFKKVGGKKPTIQKMRLKQIREANGMKGMYRCLLPSMITGLVQVPIGIGLYETLQVMRQSGSLDGVLSFVSLPVLTSAIAGLAFHPLDTMRKRMMCYDLNQTHQTSRAQVKSKSFSIFKEVLTGSSPMTLFRGYLVGVIRSLVYLSIFYGRDWLHTVPFKTMLK